MRYDLTVNEFTRDLLVKKELEIYGEHFWRPYIHVRDIARAFLTVVEAPRNKVADEVFNVGADDMNRTKAMLYREIIAELPHKDDLKVTFVAKDEDPRDYRVNFDKIRGVLGFELEWSIGRGVQEMVEHLQR
jgi:nucleoside-diphosphate-sugar epimerase